MRVSVVLERERLHECSYCARRPGRVAMHSPGEMLQSIAANMQAEGTSGSKSTWRCPRKTRVKLVAPCMSCEQPPVTRLLKNWRELRPVKQRCLRQRQAIATPGLWGRGLLR